MNIKKGNDWQGERPVQTDPTFEEFESMTMGVRAGLKLMNNQITGFGGKRKRLNTVRSLINAWAPRIENATDKYIDAVCQYTGFSPDKVLHADSRSEMLAMAKAIVRVENGQCLDDSVFDSAWSLLYNS